MLIRFSCLFLAVLLILSFSACPDPSDDDDSSTVPASPSPSEESPSPDVGTPTPLPVSPTPEATATPSPTPATPTTPTLEPGPTPTLAPPTPTLEPGPTPTPEPGPTPTPEPPTPTPAPPTPTPAPPTPTPAPPTPTPEVDADGDGYSAAIDCNDGNSDIYPGATESCDGLDNDCDGGTDEDVTTTYFVDADGDGYGVETPTLEACEKPEGYADVSGDCDDTLATVNPGQSEACDNLDNNCDGSVDEGSSFSDYFEDADGDGYGAGEGVSSCQDIAGYVTVSGDCQDDNPDINPGAEEVCNGVDDNCDGQRDEGVTTTYYEDVDGDTFGDPASFVEACSVPTGYVENSQDCDDNDADIKPDSDGTCALGTDCTTILEAGRGIDDGLYFIDPDGPDGEEAPYQVYCDMTTDGGGWTLVLNLDTSDGHVMWWADPLWTDSNTYGSPSTLFNGDHKSQAWMDYSGAGRLLLVVHEQGVYRGWKSFTKVDGATMWEYMQGSDNTPLATAVNDAWTDGLWGGERLVRLSTSLYANKCTQYGGTCTYGQGGSPDGDRISSPEATPNNNGGGGLGNWHDMGYCCSGSYAGKDCNSQTFRTVSEAQAGWGGGCGWAPEGGYFGSDSFKPGVNSCSNSDCDTANWALPNGIDYDYAIFLAR